MDGYRALSNFRNRAAEQSALCGWRLQLTFGDSGKFEQVFQQSCFDGLITVDWKGNSSGIAELRVDVMTAVNAFQFPSVFFEQSRKVFAAD